MVRTRILLALAFLAATFVAATAIPDTGNAKPSGCADSLCTDVAAVHVCPGCKGQNDGPLHAGADACATVCAVMAAVLPAPARTTPLPAGDDRESTRPAPSGIHIPPEHAPPRPSIHA